MTIHEAIATGRPHRRPIHEGYTEGRLVSYECGLHLRTASPCSGYALHFRGNLVCLGVEGLNAADWEIEHSEEDFADLAESLLNGIGIHVGEKEHV